MEFEVVYTFFFKKKRRLIQPMCEWFKRTPRIWSIFRDTDVSLKIAS